MYTYVYACTRARNAENGLWNWSDGPICLFTWFDRPYVLIYYVQQFCWISMEIFICVKLWVISTKISMGISMGISMEISIPTATLPRNQSSSQMYVIVCICVYKLRSVFDVRLSSIRREKSTRIIYKFDVSFEAEFYRSTARHIYSKTISLFLR